MVIVILLYLDEEKFTQKKTFYITNITKRYIYITTG